MTRVAAALALAAVILLLPPTPAARANPPTITPTCAPAPTECTGWYTAPSVTVTWAIENFTSVGACNGGTVSSDTAGIEFSCTASNGDGTTIRTVVIRRDATPPAVSASAGRPPDANGWYNHPLSVSFVGTDATSGMASCTSASYSGPDTAAGSLTGTCTDVAGNTSSPTSFAFRYDATPPAVTGASFSRKPDSGDWYTKPVSVAFGGSDATSGVESCTSTEYAGPDGVATVPGSCRDRAGNVGAEQRASFKFDSTAPQLDSVATTRGRGFVLLRWQASPDAAAVQVDRTPGTNGRNRTTLYRGPAQTFKDATLSRNRRYSYAVSAVDAAGNRATRTLSVPFPALYLPTAGAHVKRPPLLAWEAVRRASYYNVQLYRGKQKILTLWPAKPRLRLTRSWTLAGRRQRLVPGRYRWYVWPGYGPRARQNYGKLIGSSRFVVRR